MTWSTSIKVRFGDIDHAGIAYYPNLYHYFHVAFEEFFEQYLGTPYPEALDKERLGFPTVRVKTDFLKPLRYGDTLDISIEVPKVGRSSVDLTFTAVRRGDDTPCIVSRHTVVAVDMDTFRPRHIPPRYRDLLSACAPQA
ncbi:MAG: acyl-CoA thioesterase [Candidatus Polarisedimenticolia bacterium]